MAPRAARARAARCAGAARACDAIGEMSLTVFTTARFADHLNPPGHPERVERFSVMQVVAAEFGKRGGAVVEPRPVTDEETTPIHDADYLTLIKATSGRATALDADTFTSPASFEVARLAAGAAVSAVDHVLDERGEGAGGRGR